MSLCVMKLLYLHISSLRVQRSCTFLSSAFRFIQDTYLLHYLKSPASSVRTISDRADLLPPFRWNAALQQELSASSFIRIAAFTVTNVVLPFSSMSVAKCRNPQQGHWQLILVSNAVLSKKEINIMKAFIRKLLFQPVTSTNLFCCLSRVID